MTKVTKAHLLDDLIYVSVLKLKAWVNEDPTKRSFELDYSPYREVSATQWTGGWKVMLWSKRWYLGERPLYHVGPSIGKAADSALKYVRTGRRVRR